MAQGDAALKLLNAYATTMSGYGHRWTVDVRETVFKNTTRLSAVSSG